MNESSKGRLRHGEARIQFISNIEEIKTLLAQGMTILDVHKQLTKEKKVTMSYYTFANYCGGQRKKKT